MRFTSIILLLLVLFNFSKATPQTPDYLIVDRQLIPIFSNPLELYLAQQGISDIDRGCNASACTRGYVATWELKNDKLYLVKIEQCGLIVAAGVYGGLDCDEEERSAVLKYFDEAFEGKNSQASWFTGEIVAPQGRLIEYIHAGYETKFERDKVFSFVDGQLKGVKTQENEVKPALYEQYNYELAQDSLFHYISKLDWQQLQEDSSCTDFYLITVNKRGKVTRVKYEPLLDTKWENFWYAFSYAKCTRIIKRSVKGLRLRDYMKGVPEKMEIKLGLDYENERLLLRR